MKIVIISNRLPVKITEEENELKMVTSEGGLATGLNSLETTHEKFWVGWPGMYVEDKKEKEKINRQLKELNFSPVYLTPEQILEYYEGYSNSIIWPLCHYFYSYVTYDNKFWQTYREVNALFCEAALKIIEPGDIIWIQDYQLMLLPAMIREHISDVSIGYFHHIPFPSYELFRLLPERADILKGLMGADLIGFHTHDYMRHFISAIYRVLNMDFYLDEVQLNNRVVEIDAFPMGINYELYHDAILNPEVSKIAEELKQDYGNSKLILSVDRLDYSKGILIRLKSFADFLENHPEYRGEVSLVMIVVPSRDTVDTYADLKTRIDEMTGSINGTYSTITWTPVHYFYRSFSFEELMAMYHIADIGLVTPLRDGMNLVAKEFLAAKRDKPGVLILSEMAGAAIELTDAIIVNPNDTKEIENAIEKALKMSEEDQLRSLKRMQKVISKQTVKKWARDFISELKSVKNKNKELRDKILTKGSLEEIKSQYDKASNRLIILDYDGTLTPFFKDPKQAYPSQQLLEVLNNLADDKHNRVVINSGRDRDTLDEWLGDLPLDFSAEHGAFYKEGGKWHENIHEMDWDEEILNIVEQTESKTPKSRMEIKKTAIVWHYREVDRWLADLRVTQLINALINPCTRLGLQIMRGNKIVEIKSSDCNKGLEARRLAEQDNYDFILAMGDDTTDEDMFAMLPEDVVTIKIGKVSDAAKYNLSHQSKTLELLKTLIKKN